MLQAQTAPADGAALTVSASVANLPNGRNPLENAGAALIGESIEAMLQKNKLFAGEPSALRAWFSACVRQEKAVCRAPKLEEVPTIANGTFDSTGKITFNGVTPGTYYLLVYGLSVPLGGDQAFVWEVKADLKPGANKIVLDRGNAAVFETIASLMKPRAAPAKTAAQISEKVPPASPRPTGPKNSVLSIRATDGPNAPVSGAYIYLLDDDAEAILKRAGFKQQMLLGQPLPTLNGFEFVSRMVALKNSPTFKIFGDMTGESMIPEEVDEQYQLGLKALEPHVVAYVKTNATGRAVFPAVPAGNYFVYGTTSQWVKVGEVVRIDRSTPTPTETPVRQVGYTSATIWNKKVTVKAGQNPVVLTRENAVFTSAQ
jgi:hypothetical protein